MYRGYLQLFEKYLTFSKVAKNLEKLLIGLPMPSGH
jgi:hypothetical protein